MDAVREVATLSKIAPLHSRITKFWLLLQDDCAMERFLLQVYARIWTYKDVSIGLAEILEASSANAMEGS